MRKDHKYHADHEDHEDDENHVPVDHECYEDIEDRRTLHPTDWIVNVPSLRPPFEVKLRLFSSSTEKIRAVSLK